MKVRDPLQPITSTAPFDLISIDFLHLDQSSGGYEYIMLIVDHFTKFVQGYATRNKSRHTAAERLFNEYIPRFGFPSRIIHDQGGEFENKMFNPILDWVRAHPILDGGAKKPPMLTLPFSV